MSMARRERNRRSQANDEAKLFIATVFVVLFFLWLYQRTHEPYLILFLVVAVLSGYQAAKRGYS